MLNRIFVFSILLVVLFVSFTACKSDENADTTAPLLISSTPADGATAVDPKAIISFNYNDKIVLSSSAKILLNNVAVSATVNSQTLTIAGTLQPGTSYTLIIPANAISDASGNYSKEIKITFTTTGNSVDGVYEAEKAAISGDAAIATALSGYSGAGYVNTNTGNVTFTVQAATAGYYDLSFRYSTSGSEKINDLYVDGTKLASLTFNAVNVWTTLSAGKVKLSAGAHTIAIIKSWGYIQLDYMTAVYNAAGIGAFNIATSLVTPNPSTQAVNLYNFLKTNFGTNIISGTMANYSTNIAEATWVHTQTGKWPALTGFDLINHTIIGANWVEYSAPFTLGQDWWNNNGIVAMTWHWRDPLTKTGSFYVPSAATLPDTGTTFDITKVSDPTSAEYKAMIVDIDVIAGYLKQFRDAGIPVVWRPLHEAAGGWFWWGAKGAEPCKALWKLLFDRLVNYHGLNNLIWVWTTDATADAVNWYPGDAYVDVLGMDIYPGANQHGSQYISFLKVKELFGGKKLITLSECGSAPDPALMKEYGDTWSWFMPWNGDYTESDSHNGATWWKKYFSYDYVITRDKMPSLK
ncbi:MAG TPA: glycosyl hydrolase [Paludibacter sp.]|nr:glycosyl hydrolase [Paludibacter sp.]